MADLDDPGSATRLCQVQAASCQHSGRVAGDAMIFILLMVVYLKAGPQLVAQPFPDAYSCQMKMGAMANEATKSPAIHGFAFLPNSCDAVSKANKI